jgi:hypothetical protein
MVAKLLRPPETIKNACTCVCLIERQMSQIVPGMWERKREEGSRQQNFQEKNGSIVSQIPIQTRVL